MVGVDAHCLTIRPQFRVLGSMWVLCVVLLAIILTSRLLLLV